MQHSECTKLRGKLRDKNTAVKECTQKKGHRQV